MSEVTLETRDSIDYKPDLSIVGSQWTQAEGQPIYTIMGYIYNVKANLWMLMIQHMGANFQVCIAPSDFADEYTRVQ